MAASYADIMYKTFSLVAERGNPRMAVGEGTDVMIYAQLNGPLKNGYAPAYKGTFAKKKVEEILALAKEAGISVDYYARYTDSYSSGSFTAFIIHTNMP